MVAILRQAAQSNVMNFGVSFYLQGMHYMKANNASSEFSTSSRVHVARRDSASQYLSQVLVDTNILNQRVMAPTQRLISVYNFGAVSPFRKNSSSCLLHAFYYLNRLIDTQYLLFQKQKLTPCLSTSSRLQKQASRYGNAVA